MNKKIITDSSRLFVPLPRSDDPLNYLLIFFLKQQQHISNAYKRYERFLLPIADIARTDPMRSHEMKNQKNNSVSIFQKPATLKRIRPDEVCSVYIAMSVAQSGGADES